jgi:hypothetical protein
VLFHYLSLVNLNRENTVGQLGWRAFARITMGKNRGQRVQLDYSSPSWPGKNVQVTQQSVTKFVAIKVVNLITAKASFKHGLPFNKPALDENRNDAIGLYLPR